MRLVRTLLALLALIVLALPLSAVVTILLLPFWSWLEASSGVEAVGHSGPAGWCYLLVFAIMAAGGAALALLRPLARGRARGWRLRE
jgi:hypothetical protein